jgi:nitric oxide synthase-interacting protein
MEAWAADDVRRAAEARAKARERVVADFERGMGFAARKTATTSTGARDSKRETTAGSASASASASASDSKIIREDEIERIALQAEESALAAIEAEAGEARKAKLAAFWLPSLTPEAPLGPLAAVKLQTLCHVGGRPHPYTAKNLRPVVFTYPPGSKEKEGKPTCPSCTKELTNASGAVLLASRVSAPAPTENGDRDEPARKKSKKDKKKDKDTVAVCGHVVCRACANTLVRPAHRCCVCEASVEDKDILELGKEGECRLTAGTSGSADKQEPASRLLGTPSPSATWSHLECRHCRTPVSVTMYIMAPICVRLSTSS